MKTMCQACPDPVSGACSHTSGRHPASALQQQSHHTHHNSTPVFCVPTKAALIYTSPWYCLSSYSMSCPFFQGSAVLHRSLQPPRQAESAHPSLQTTAALQAVQSSSCSGHVCLHYGCNLPLLQVVPAYQGLPQSPFLPHSAPCLYIFRHFHWWSHHHS